MTKESIKEDITSLDSPFSTAVSDIPKPMVCRIAQLFITGQYNFKEIANILKITPETVSRWVKTPVVRDMINDYQKEESIMVDQAIKAVRMKAVNKMNELLDADNEMVQWQAARDILDRTGHKADNKTTVNVNVRTFEEQLNDLIEDVDFKEESTD